MIKNTSYDFTRINWNSTNTILDETANYYLELFENINESLVADFDKTIKSILKGIKIEDYIRMNWCPLELSIKYEKILSIKNNFFYNIDNKKNNESNNIKPNNDIEQYINSIKEGAKKRGEVISDYELPVDPYEDYAEIPEELANLLKE